MIPAHAYVLFEDGVFLGFFSDLNSAVSIKASREAHFSAMARLRPDLHKPKTWVIHEYTAVGTPL